MTLQGVAFTIALVGIGLVSLGFIFVVIQAGKPAGDAETRKVTHVSHRLQGIAFAVLLVVFVVGSWATLHNFPIPAQAGTLDSDQVVKVVGHQWFWQISPATVQVGKTVEFRVTSADVNHGFAIYAPDGRIVTQTQAMPGYTNKLLHTFGEPGTYMVRCLEYCGLAHARMAAEIQVVSAEQAKALAQNAQAPAESAGQSSTRTTAGVGEAAPDGKRIYASKCAVCHQANGQGMPNVFPPLKGNDVVNNPNPTEHIHVVLFGLQGKAIDGVTYAAAMPGWKDVLSNAEIAAVINHERRSWGNTGQPVTPEQVAKVRSAGP